MTGAELQATDDAELVRRAIAAQGDPEALAPVFGAIADQYSDMVLSWCAGRGLEHQAAQDVGQTVFLDAFTSLASGRGPRQGELLGRWLAGFVRNRALAYFRRDSTREKVMLAAEESFDDLPGDEEDRSGYAVRLAHASPLVNVVVASLEERHRVIYQLYFVEHLNGRQIGERLAISEKTASNRVTRVQQVVADGFGALILAQEGRPYCPVLAGLLDAAQVQVITEENFTAALRTRIVRHFDTCDTCDRCQVCAGKRRQLAGPYAPALVPLLFGTAFRERIAEVIRQVCSGQEPPARKPRRRGPRRRGPRFRARTLAGAGAVLAVVVVAAVVLAARPWHSRPSASVSAAAVHQHAGAPGGLPPVHWRELRILSDPAGSGNVLAVAVSPDGRTLATGHYGGGSYLWDLSGPRLVATMSTGTGIGGNDVMSLALSPDGKTVAAGMGSGQIFVRDVSSTRVTETLDDGYGQGGVNSLAFSPDGTTLATGTLGGPGLVVLWDPATGQQIARINPGLGAVAAVAFSPDGKTLAIGGDGGTVLRDLATGQMTNITAATAASGPVMSLAFSPDGKTLAIGGGGATVLWDLATSRNSAILPGDAFTLAYSPDGTILATGQNGVTLWATATGRKIVSFPVQQITSVAFVHDGTLTANDGTGVIVWESAR